MASETACICEFDTLCGDDDKVACLGCGGDFCVCAACGGEGMRDCLGCENCSNDDDEGRDPDYGSRIG